MDQKKVYIQTKVRFCLKVKNLKLSLKKTRKESKRK